MKVKCRLKRVNERRIVKSIVKLRKKVKGELRLRSVLEEIERMEGVYVNRSLIGNMLREKRMVENVNGVDMVVVVKKR